MITFKQKGDFSKLNNYFQKALGAMKFSYLDKYGKQGVAALTSATPKDTGKTSNSWYYEVIREDNSVRIEWKNSNINDYVNIAIILQYGHATRNGGYVQGRDYINPSLRPIFDEMAEKAWKEVTDT